jgi:hypothetical protein
VVDAKANGQHDAHVQVLTAEVRTLMVGSRQVTLSVYNQLDDVGYDQIEPFGRVSPKDARRWQLCVVGRDRGTGALARSWVPNERGLSSLKEHGGLASNGGHYRPAIWFDADEAARRRVCEVSQEWSDLPLIVLAGLR